jgi:hypothetical protein
VFYEPNITIVTSPTRAPAQASLIISVDGAESADTTKRHLRQQKSIDTKSPVSPEHIPNVEIKRETSVQDMETTQQMEGTLFYEFKR